MAEMPASGSDAGARLDALRALGVDRCDLVRFSYLEALARRAAGQPASIRQPLMAKILAEAEELAARHAAGPAAVEETSGASAASPLADLLAYIGGQAIAPTKASEPARRPMPRPKAQNRTPAAPELKSVTYFRQTWSKLSTEQQLTQTLAQAPENAGPMNSQHLVLRALKTMREHSPDYLQGFMSYIDTLIWLEQASPAKPNTERAPAGGSEKKTKTTKSGRTK